MSQSRRAGATKRVNIYDSEVGTEIRSALILLEENPALNTQGGYSANHDKYPDGVIPFVEKHLLYLHLHPLVNPDHYLSNLRLQLRAR